MEAATRELLLRISECCQRVGMASDLEDRGDPGGARELADGARGEIAELLGAATEEDRARVDGLFGAGLPARCDTQSWHRISSYARFLVERGAELPPVSARERERAFVERVADLQGARGGGEVTLTVRYPGGVPWMPNTLRALLQRGGDRLGSCGTPPVSLELDLAGNGIRCELRRSGPEPCDALIDGVLVQVELDRESARGGTKVRLRARDREALARVARELRTALEADGWVTVEADRS